MFYKYRLGFFKNRLSFRNLPLLTTLMHSHRMSVMYLMKVGRKGLRLFLVSHSHKQVPPYGRNMPGFNGICLLLLQGGREPILHGRKRCHLRIIKMQSKTLLIRQGGKEPIFHGRKGCHSIKIVLVIRMTICTYGNNCATIRPLNQCSVRRL